MKITTLKTLPVESVSHNAEIQKQVMLRMGEVPHLTNFSQVRFQPGQVAEAHTHIDMHEVFFAESGEGTIVIDGISHALTPGVCVAVAPHESHEVSNSGEIELVLTYFGLKA